MKFYDIDQLASKIGVSNKYLLTSLVASNARQMSDRKSRLIEEGKEKFISLVLDEMDSGKCTFPEQSDPLRPTRETRELQNAPVEEES
ncbi:MAG TPA: DNA-directed RNA polymerase subunit omega [Synergistales bacterium]|nr:DNA-directed RNA polymerase subunit omega [Synergistales bacterium]